MNSFDFAILRFVTSFANVWPAFDAVTNRLVTVELLKGGVAMALFWAAWFGSGSDDRRRQLLIATLAGAAVALGVAIVLALVLPFRVRPLLAFQSPGMVVPPSWKEWSAFPSDHATLFFALAAGIYRAVPRLGWLALAHALVVVCLPRVYIGLHYPTDIIGGAVIGAGLAWLATSAPLRQHLSAWSLAQMRRFPAGFYAVLFLVSYLIATLFADLRQNGLALYEYLFR